MDGKKYNENKKKSKVRISPLQLKRHNKDNRDELDMYAETNKEKYGIHTVRSREKIDANNDLFVELEEWAETTDAIHISEFCSPRKFSYKMLKKESESNPHLKDALEKAMDRIAKNIRDQWKMDYRLGELSKMYLPIFDETIREHKREMTEMVSRRIAANTQNNMTINIVDSSGYLNAPEQSPLEVEPEEEQ